MDEHIIRELAVSALKMRELSYVPYSDFAVGAALLTKDGRIFTGCNVENAAFGPSICAERTAVAKAVSEGAREFAAIAVAGGKRGEPPKNYCPPCGVCRQVLAEFSGPDMPVIVVKSEEEIRITTLGDLLPQSFTPADLG